MNIDGLSESTLEKFIAKGYVTELADLFRLGRYREEIIAMEGLGEKTFSNLMRALQTARKTTPARLLYSLGMAGIGVANAKRIAKACKNQWAKIEALTEPELVDIDGIGDIMAEAFVAFFQSEDKKSLVRDLLSELELNQSFEEASDQPLSGVTFVITGSLTHFENRDRLKALIEEKGGKTSGSVSSKTNYLINNDSQSNSSKNKKAGELGIPVITEEAFLVLLEGQNS
jgi:DNA ligase (NAD+)